MHVENGGDCQRSGQIYRTRARPCRPRYCYRSCFPCHKVNTLPIRNSLLVLMRLRHMEDFVTWVDTSKLKRTIMKYNDEASYQYSILDLFYTELWLSLSWTTSTCYSTLIIPFSFLWCTCMSERTGPYIFRARLPTSPACIQKSTQHEPFRIDIGVH